MKEPITTTQQASNWLQDIAATIPDLDRECLGKITRKAADQAEESLFARPGRKKLFKPWDESEERLKEVYRRIGENVRCAVIEALQRNLPNPKGGAS